MKKFKIQKSPSVIIIAVVALFTVIAVTLGIFFSNVEVERLFNVSNFSASCNVSFEGGATITAGTPISVNYSDPSASNYIGKLRISVNYTGYGVGFVRVRIVEEWSTTAGGIKTVLPYTTRMPYTVSTYSASSGNQKSWYDNRTLDHCFYYATPVYSAEAESTAVTIPLVTGFDTSAIDLGAIASGTALNVIIEAEAVQVNRYPQFWGIDRLPWTNGSSSSPQTITN